MRHILSAAIILTIIILVVLYFFSEPTPTMTGDQAAEPVNPEMMEPDSTPGRPETVQGDDQPQQ